MVESICLGMRLRPMQTDKSKTNKQSRLPITVTANIATASAWRNRLIIDAEQGKCQLLFAALLRLGLVLCLGAHSFTGSLSPSLEQINLVSSESISGKENGQFAMKSKVKYRQRINVRGSVKALFGALQSSFPQLQFGRSCQC